MTTDQFRDAIANERIDYEDFHTSVHDCVGNDLADAILAMPQMQAIRSFLRGVEADSDWEALKSYGLPADVIAWVMDGDQ